jgi:hypothetical protein
MKMASGKNAGNGCGQRMWATDVDILEVAVATDARNLEVAVKYIFFEYLTILLIFFLHLYRKARV